jgi:hypothetical protein
MKGADASAVKREMLTIKFIQLTFQQQSPKLAHLDFWLRLLQSNDEAQDMSEAFGIRGSVYGE